jgi:predicted molibdopterin-dependent oxidoreductase YjgC
MDLPGSGVIQLLPGANSQGLANLGVKNCEPYIEAINNGIIRGLFIFCVFVKNINLQPLEFLCVHDMYLTDTAGKAHIVFPAPGFGEYEGSYTSADGKTQRLHKAIDSQGIGVADLLGKLA